jgi:hypothetical protein
MAQYIEILRFGREPANARQMQARTEFHRNGVYVETGCQPCSPGTRDIADAGAASATAPAVALADFFGMCLTT